MAVVTNHLVSLITKQVADYRLVVWYDPDQSYVSVASELELPNTTVARYDDSFFQLRHEIDGLLNDVEPPRLLVYVPKPHDHIHNALAELEAMGVVMRPGQQPPTRNTKLSLVAKNALKSIIGEDTAFEVEKQVEAGKLTLADVNALADKGGELSTGVLALVFGTGNPQEVALAFLGSDQFDSEIESKEAAKELVGLVTNTFGIEFTGSESLGDIRTKLARHVLLTDFLSRLGEPVPPSLSSVDVATSPSTVDVCQRLANTWRQTRDNRDGYTTAANSVEQEFSIGDLELNVNQLGEVETFIAVERRLMQHSEDRLLESADEGLLAQAQSRLGRFWSDVNPTTQAHWALIAAAAEVLLEADRVEKCLKKPPATVRALIKAYAEGKSPWCLLDTHHRHMETRWHNFDPSEQHEGLEKLVIKSRQRYTDVGSQLAKHFIGKYEKAKHPVSGVVRQRDVFESQVKPRITDGGKVAYVWVDALRFEMARELCDVLGDDFKLAIQPALATVPTITEIGMASLLPKATEAKVVSVGGGKLALEIDGNVIKSRKDRIDFLKAHAGCSVFDTKLENLLPKPSNLLSARLVRDIL